MTTKKNKRWGPPRINSNNNYDPPNEWKLGYKNVPQSTRVVSPTKYTKKQSQPFQTLQYTNNYSNNNYNRSIPPPPPPSNPLPQTPKKKSYTNSSTNNNIPYQTYVKKDSSMKHLHQNKVGNRKISSSDQLRNVRKVPKHSSQNHTTMFDGNNRKQPKRPKSTKVSKNHFFDNNSNNSNNSNNDYSNGNSNSNNNGKSKRNKKKSKRKMIYQSNMNNNNNDNNETEYNDNIQNRNNMLSEDHETVNNAFFPPNSYDTNDSNGYINGSNNNFKFKKQRNNKKKSGITLDEQNSLNELSELTTIFEDSLDDVNQTIVDVKETSLNVKNTIKSVIEQLHMILDKREDELLNIVSELTAKKIFALDQQYTRISQRLQFCKDAKEEAHELLSRSHEYNNSSMSINSNDSRHSVKSQKHYNERRNRIMNIVNNSKMQAKNELNQLNNGPIVNTKFYIDHLDITKQLETLGSIIEDNNNNDNILNYKIYSPIINNIKTFKRALRINMKTKEKVYSKYINNFQCLNCEMEVQLCFIDKMLKNNDNHSNISSNNSDITNNNIIPSNNMLTWDSLGWIELNPIMQSDTKFVNTPTSNNNNDMNIPKFSQIMSEPTKKYSRKHIKTLTFDYQKVITGLENTLINAVNNDKDILIRIRIKKELLLNDIINTYNNNTNKNGNSIFILSSFSKKKLLRLDINNKIHTTNIHENNTIIEAKTPPSPINIHQSRSDNTPNGSTTADDEKNISHTITKLTGDTTNDTTTKGGNRNKARDRSHSNYHMNDDQYEPGVLMLYKNEIIWQDLMNNTEILLSDNVPVCDRKHCGIVVAHDVLVADEDEEMSVNTSKHTYTREHSIINPTSPTTPIIDDVSESEVTSNINNSRYTSIMFRIGGQLNNKKDRSVDMLDLSSGIWSSLPPLKHGRSFIPVVLMNGTIIVTGGLDRNNKPLNGCEIFNFESNKWDSIPNMKDQRYNHSSYVLNYGYNTSNNNTLNNNNNNYDKTKLFVCGGSTKKKKNIKTCERYDVKKNYWNQISSLNIPRTKCVLTEWISMDKIACIGGYGGSNSNLNKIVEYYDTNKNKWYQIESLNYEHINCASGLLTFESLSVIKRHINDINVIKHFNNHKISNLNGRPLPFVFGSNDQKNSFELYDNRVNQWIILNSYQRHKKRIYNMIECALPTRILNDKRISNNNNNNAYWTRRGSRVVGIK